MTADEIRLGASVVMSGPLGPQTAQYGEGSRLLFDAVNAQGGVHGRMIRYTTLDDAFDPQKAVENTRQLLENDKVCRGDPGATAGWCKKSSNRGQ